VHAVAAQKKAIMQRDRLRRVVEARLRLDPKRARKDGRSTAAAFPGVIRREAAETRASQAVRARIAIALGHADAAALDAELARARADVRQELGATDRSLVMGTIARLDPVKDLTTLIRGLACLMQSRRLGDIRPILVVIGDGAERDLLAAEARTLGVTADVRFLGHRDDARRWLPAFDIYINTSTSEGVSLTILEAMAAGLPVVATAVGGTPEVVAAGAGRLILPRSPEALADALADLAGSADHRAAIGRAARARVEAEFTIERMVRQYHDIYREVA